MGISSYIVPSVISHNQRLQAYLHLWWQSPGRRVWWRSRRARMCSDDRHRFSDVHHWAWNPSQVCTSKLEQTQLQLDRTRYFFAKKTGFRTPAPGKSRTFENHRKPVVVPATLTTQLLMRHLDHSLALSFGLEDPMGGKWYKEQWQMGINPPFL